MILHLSLQIVVVQSFDEATVTANLAETIITHTLARIFLARCGCGQAVLETSKTK